MSKLHVRAAFAIGVALFAAASCGGDDSGAGSATTAAGETAAPGATTAAPDDTSAATQPATGGGVLQLSDPGNAGAAAYAKREGILEERLAEVGATVKWGGAYPNGTASFDAVRAGELDVFGGNTTVSVGYLSVTDDATVVALGDPRSGPASAGLFVQPDGPIQTIQDLVGKRIGVNIGGYGEYLLLLALQENGIDPDSVERVNLQSNEAAAAFVGGSVDGYVAIVNAYQPAIDQGFKELFSNNDVNDEAVSVVAVRDELLNEHPEVVKVYLDTLAELTLQAQQEPEKFQNVFLDEGPTAVSGTRLEAAIAQAKVTTPLHTPTAEDVERFQRVADTFYENGAIAAPLDAASVVIDVNTLLGG